MSGAQGSIRQAGMNDIPIDPQKARRVVLMMLAWIILSVGFAVGVYLSPHRSRFADVSALFVAVGSIPYLIGHARVLKTAYLGPNRGLHLVGDTLIFATRKYRSIQINEIASCDVAKLRNWARDLPYLELGAKNGRKIELPIFLLADEPQNVRRHVQSLLEAAETDAIPPRDLGVGKPPK